MMVGKEEVDHEHVSLLCSTQVGSPSVSLWYVLWTALKSGHWPDERRYISNLFIHSWVCICSLFGIIVSDCFSMLSETDPGGHIANNGSNAAVTKVAREADGWWCHQTERWADSQKVSHHFHFINSLSQRSPLICGGDLLRLWPFFYSISFYHFWSRSPRIP